MPFVRLELAVFTVLDERLQVLIGRRAQAPYASRWALPGGALRTYLDQDMEAGCRRVAHERLGTTLGQLWQVGAEGAKRRDPRAPRAQSVIYRGLIQSGEIAASPDKRLDALRWEAADAAAESSALAFDHVVLTGRAVLATRDDVQALRFPRNVLPDGFTLGELQAVSEAVLGRSLDNSSFRRRLDDAGCMEPVEGALRTGEFRAAKLYRLAELLWRN